MSQRPGYHPAQSPPNVPLHHPVPQHISAIPMMRSPPPLVQSSSSSAYGSSPYQTQHQMPPPQQQQQQQQQGGSGGLHPAYGGFLNDPTAQMGFQVGQSAVMAGQHYVEQNWLRWFGSTQALKHYFNVSNSYVVMKLRLVLFPWRHRPWSRTPKGVAPGQDGQFLPPRDDINSPDMYIPVMAFVTYILLSTMLAGLDGTYKPELLGSIATAAFVIVIFEIMGLKLGCYLLNISNESQLLDLVAYSGYKFVGIIVTMIVQSLFRKSAGLAGWLTWIAFGYCFGANAFFLLRSLKYVLLPENSADNPRGSVQVVARAQRNRRTQFLFFYAYVVQFLFMWILSKT